MFIIQLNLSNISIQDIYLDIFNLLHSKLYQIVLFIFFQLQRHKNLLQIFFVFCLSIQFNDLALKPHTLHNNKSIKMLIGNIKTPLQIINESTSFFCTIYLINEDNSLQLFKDYKNFVIQKMISQIFSKFHSKKICQILFMLFVKRNITFKIINAYYQVQNLMYNNLFVLNTKKDILVNQIKHLQYEQCSNIHLTCKWRIYIFLNLYILFQDRSQLEKMFEIWIKLFYTLILQYQKNYLINEFFQMKDSQNIEYFRLEKLQVKMLNLNLIIVTMSLTQFLKSLGILNVQITYQHLIIIFKMYAYIGQEDSSGLGSISFFFEECSLCLQREQNEIRSINPNFSCQEFSYSSNQYLKGYMRIFNQLCLMLNEIRNFSKFTF
ncbi:unnamed protein product [Paramecium sonneborni]|uniref:Uncharacterized protein n=1 Tax=Paramecium sonneborni TaxID=65129 RepID=A0A8S1RIZ4_9CILI|nr:unnamed protein product [Paramecium sonneborni]